MRGLEKKYLLIIFVFSFTLSFLIIPGSNDTYEPNEVVGITTTEPTDTVYDESIEYDNMMVERQEAADITDSPIILNNYLLSISSAFLITLTINILLMVSIISQRLKQFIFISSKLAGFSSDMLFQGRDVFIDDNVHLHFRLSYRISIVAHLPLRENHLKFGLVNQKSVATTTFSVDQLPMKMLVFYQYLTDPSK
ncbi:MAG: hypothetical protein INQ03_06440 [Candidatus Heimdallarchaeota archaeon]|nr:hypothetical protein [Candidatus Heimdallarchaeota archaeon]